MGVMHKFDIDPRISPKQFMELLGCKTTCFYGKIKRGEIKKPYYDGKKDYLLACLLCQRDC